MLARQCIDNGPGGYQGLRVVVAVSCSLGPSKCWETFFFSPMAEGPLSWAVAFISLPI